MKLWDKITGNDMTKEFRNLESRAEKLPLDYQKAWESILDNLWLHSSFTGRNLMPILEGVMSLLEDSAYNNLSVQEVFGGDVDSFCKELMDAEGPNTFRDKWRKKLNKKINRKLNK